MSDQKKLSDAQYAQLAPLLPPPTTTTCSRRWSDERPGPRGGARRSLLRTETAHRPPAVLRARPPGRARRLGLRGVPAATARGRGPGPPRRRRDPPAARSARPRPQDPGYPQSIHTDDCFGVSVTDPGIRAASDSVCETGGDQETESPCDVRELCTPSACYESTPTRVTGVVCQETMPRAGPGSLSQATSHSRNLQLRAKTNCRPETAHVVSDIGDPQHNLQTTECRRDMGSQVSQSQRPFVRMTRPQPP